jgi:hypothetical protein
VHHQVICIGALHKQANVELSRQTNGWLRFGLMQIVGACSFTCVDALDMAPCTIVVMPAMQKALSGWHLEVEKAAIRELEVRAGCTHKAGDRLRRGQQPTTGCWRQHGDSALDQGLLRSRCRVCQADGTAAR